MKKSRIYKKDVEALVEIIITKGYWSEEVLDFNEGFQPCKVEELHNRARLIVRSTNR